jgi:hypothetical protein
VLTVLYDRHLAREQFFIAGAECMCLQFVTACSIKTNFDKYTKTTVNIQYETYKIFKKSFDDLKRIK